MESSFEIAEHLKMYAHTYVFSRGFKFGSGADNDINRMAETSAINMVNPPISYADVPLILLVGIAEKRLAIFIDHMIIARPKVYTDTELESQIIGERTFGWARNIICPIFPLC
ncbi:MAG: hypothetical protein JWN56_250 [Sphingobacteriales bacterium]|nr:hypothetical protein [Sphingobacteriales bacterium]